MRALFLMAVFLIGLQQATAETKVSDIVSEVRLGVLAFNPDININPSNEGQEGGANIQAEILFHTPKRLRWKYFFAPEPFILGFVHDGTIDIPFPGMPGNLENEIVSEDNILFGSRDLFRTTFAINRHINERVGVSFVYEHLSHGQILGSGRNQGSDSLGGRVYYRFGKSYRRKK